MHSWIQRSSHADLSQDASQNQLRHTILVLEAWGISVITFDQAASSLPTSSLKWLTSTAPTRSLPPLHRSGSVWLADRCERDVTKVTLRRRTRCVRFSLSQTGETWECCVSSYLYFLPPNARCVFVWKVEGVSGGGNRTHLKPGSFSCPDMFSEYAAASIVRHWLCKRNPFYCVQITTWKGQLHTSRSFVILPRIFLPAFHSHFLSWSVFSLSFSPLHFLLTVRYWTEK